jgi:hypothetical protein
MVGWTKFRLAGFLGLAGLAMTNGCSAADLSMHGVWRGMIGKYPVMACFSLGEGFHFGSYYYLSQLKLIPLSENDGGAGWTEQVSGGLGNNGPSWVISTANQTSASGQWKNGGRVLPIALQRVKLPEADDQLACGSEAFNEARFTPVTKTVEPAQLGEIAYTKIKVDLGKQFDGAFSSFALSGDSDGTRKVNAALRSTIPDPENSENFRSCMMGAAGAQGTNGSYDFDIVPTIISKSFMIAKWEAGDYCGGAHPNLGYGYDVYDLQSGDKLDVSTWFDLAAAKPVVRQIVQTQAEAGSIEKDCGEAILENEFWNFGLSREGFLFLPDLPHAMQACSTEFGIRFDDMMPFLSGVGKDIVVRLMADLK